MRRINLTEVRNDVNMAMIKDADNNFMYDRSRLNLYRGELQDKVMNTTMKMKLQASKEDKDTAMEQLISLMEDLNVAFNRSIGAPESMKLFKVIDKTAAYAGNETVVVTLNLATLATGAGSAIYAMLGYNGMSVNIWGTEANVFEAVSNVSNETYGLGNAMRSWKSVMKREGKDFVAIPKPAYLINYL